MNNARIVRADEAQTVTFDWGSLDWYAGRALANSDDMTVGRCTIKPGRENPAHIHPNCEEVLHLVQGRIAHTAGDEVIEMAPGDTITIPRHVRHNARNIGDVDAVMYISFSSADRQMQAE